MIINFTNFNKSFQKLYSILEQKEKKKFFLALTLILLGVFLEMFSISLFIPLLSLFSSDINQSNFFINLLINFFNIKLTNNVDYYFKIILILILILFFIKTIYFSLSIWFQNYFAFKIHSSFSKKIFYKYLNENYDFFLNNNSAFLIRNCFTEIEKLIRGVLTPAMMLVTEIFVVFGLSMLLLFFEPLGFLISFVYFSSAVYIFLLITKKKLYVWGKNIQNIDGVRLKYLQQSFGAIKEIKLMGKESFFYDIYLNKLYKSNSIYTKVSTLSQLPRFWLEYIVVVGLVLLIFFLFYLENTTNQIIPIIGLFAIIAFRLLPSVNRIVNCIQSLRFNKPVIDVLYNELTSKKLNKDFINLKSLNNKNLKFNNILELKNIDFGYNALDKKVLNNFSIKILKGESLGIVGTSGSGKTTLLDLILGLLIPQNGTISFDSKNIHENLSFWQGQIGYVPQNCYLIDDSLRKNIALGIRDEDIDHDNLNDAIEKAQLKDFISQLDDGLNSNIGEKGIKISGGQRQRISIARALYNNPSILIFDEATNALDQATEKNIISSINSLKKDKTILFVSHNKDILNFCDKIYDISIKKYIS